MSEITYEILEPVAIISRNGNGLTKQVNRISWNNQPAVIDIRAWSAKGKPYKGITLTLDEARALREALNNVLNRMGVLTNEQQEHRNSE